VKRSGFALRIPDPKARKEVPVHKPKKCRQCKETYTPVRSMQLVCSGTCGIAYAQAQTVKTVKEEQKAERKQDRERKTALKTRSDYIKEAQREFNKYIRLRDRGQLCICCDQPLGSSEVGGAYDCGHYRSVGSAPHLRFDPRNAHAQTKKCNRYGAGRAVDYRRGLVRRLGADVVEMLEADQSPKHYDIDQLKAIKAKYRALANQLEKQR
jgi:ribosomal protein L14E/L6E/L27E